MSDTRPTLKELARCFAECGSHPEPPKLFAPFHFPIYDTFSYAPLLNKYGRLMRLVPPDTIGPIENPHISDDAVKVAIYIKFPQQLPTPDHPWVMKMMTPDVQITIDTLVFLPLFGEGRVVAIVDLTRETGTFIVSPHIHPADFVHVIAPRAHLAVPHKPVRSHDSLRVPSEGRTWPRLRKAISSQFDKLRKASEHTKPSEI
ncbi:hypothetical protein OH77DRAFT_1514380 [Trametes cingulata]|nr:hypothetical protein OH77DRAFT_1514380 [Trametes cingulata]